MEISYFTSGTVVGPRLRGTVLGGGGDWAVYRTADSFEIDVRAVLRAGEGGPIYLRYSGLWSAKPGSLKKLFALHGFDTFVASEHYIRVLARFQTAIKRYSWLNDTVAVGVGSLEADDMIGYDFYDIG